MKKYYTLTILIFVFTVVGCSKDFLRKYDKRIVGTWQIADVDDYGLGGNTNNLPFTQGNFTFYDTGALMYVTGANDTLRGSWDIIKKTIDDQVLHGLEITAVNYSTQESFSQYYDDMNFTGTNRFRAQITSGFHTYVTIFKR